MQRYHQCVQEGPPACWPSNACFCYFSSRIAGISTLSDSKHLRRVVEIWVGLVEKWKSWKDIGNRQKTWYDEICSTSLRRHVANLSATTCHLSPFHQHDGGVPTSSEFSRRWVTAHQYQSTFLRHPMGSCHECNWIRETNNAKSLLLQFIRGSKNRAKFHCRFRTEDTYKLVGRKLPNFFLNK